MNDMVTVSQTALVAIGFIGFCLCMIFVTIPMAFIYEKRIQKLKKQLENETK